MTKTVTQHHQTRPPPKPRLLKPTLSASPPPAPPRLSPQRERPTHNNPTSGGTPTTQHPGGKLSLRCKKTAPQRAASASPGLKPLARAPHKPGKPKASTLSASPPPAPPRLSTRRERPTTQHPGGRPSVSVDAGTTAQPSAGATPNQPGLVIRNPTASYAAPRDELHRQKPGNPKPPPSPLRRLRQRRASPASGRGQLHSTQPPRWEPIRFLRCKKTARPSAGELPQTSPGMSSEAR